MATEIERLDELLTKQEAKVRRAFLRYVELVQGSSVMALVLERLEQNDVRGAFAIIETYIARYADVLSDIQLEVGRETAAELQRLVGDAAAAISFDASFPRAAELVRTQRLGLIREFSDGQFRAVQQAVARGVSQGMGALELARRFRSAVGLTAQQESAVANFRRLLENDPAKALGRELRDRRFDRAVARAADDGTRLNRRQIDTMVNRYRARAIMARADTISRTEALRAYSEAREEALEQMLDQTGIDHERVERTWNSTRDERVRDHHAAMQGQKRPLGEPFVDGLGNRLRYPGDPDAPAETVIQCRCTLTFRIAPAAQLARAA